LRNPLGRFAEQFGWTGRQWSAHPLGLDSPSTDVALRRLEVGVAPGPLDDDRRVATHRHVREPGVAEVVKDESALKRIALDVERLTKDADVRKSFRKSSARASGGAMWSRRPFLPCGAETSGSSSAERWGSTSTVRTRPHTGCDDQAIARARV
jgi:hypothetical protein